MKNVNMVVAILGLLFLSNIIFGQSSENSSLTNVSKAQKTEKATSGTVTNARIRLHRGSKGCNWEFGICKVHGPADCSPPAKKCHNLTQKELREGWAIANLSLEKDKLRVEVLSPLQEKGEVLTIDEDIVLDEKLSQSLGTKSLTILKGEYKVDYSQVMRGKVIILATCGICNIRK
jgi:hypothetical protein